MDLKQFDNYIDNWCTLVRAAENIIYSSPIYNKVLNVIIQLSDNRHLLLPMKNTSPNKRGLIKKKIIKQRQKSVP